MRIEQSTPRDKREELIPASGRKDLSSSTLALAVLHCAEPLAPAFFDEFRDCIRRKGDAPDGSQALADPFKPPCQVWKISQILTMALVYRRSASLRERLVFAASRPKRETTVAHSDASRQMPI